MQDVLILGGTQYFGKKLVEKLIENGKNVTIATRGLTPDPFGNKVNRLFIDREKKETLLKAFAGKSWDVVFDQSCLSPQEAKDASEVLKGKAKRYIFTSSQAVYEYGTNHKEEDFDPKTFTYSYKGRLEYPGYAGYQEAKRASEAVIFNQTCFKAAAVRFPIVIGKDDYTGRLKFHVDKVTNQQTIGAKKTDVRFSFILSDEAAEFVYKLGDSDFVGSINPGCKGDISLLELIAKIETHVRKKAVIKHELTKDNASPYGLDGSWAINTDKAKRLGFHFSDLDQSLNELIDYYAGLDAIN